MASCTPLPCHEGATTGAPRRLVGAFGEVLITLGLVLLLVLEGTDHDTLTQGVGHYEGTAMPGLIGSFAVAGHRTTYGRPRHNIDLMRSGDVIVVETRASYVVYAVARHVIVTPDHVEVIAPCPNALECDPRRPG